MAKIKKISNKAKALKMFKKVGDFFRLLRSKMTKKRLIVLFLVLFAVVFWRAFLVRKSNFSVEVYTVARGEMIESFSSSGKVQASQKVDLAFQTPGQIAWVSVKEGDRVGRGQAVAGLDTIKANSAYQIALSTLRLAEATVDRVHDDVKNHASDETFLIKETRVMAETNKDKAYEGTIMAKKDLDNSLLVSPFAGIAANLANNLISGANIISGITMLSVFNPETLYFEAEVNEVDVVNLKSGQKTIIRLDAYPADSFEGTISSIGYISVLTPTGGTAYKVRVILPLKKEIVYRLGMKGDAEFVLNKKENVVLVPTTAVVEEKDQSFVWVVDNENKVKKVEIKTGSTSVNAVEIISGVETGEKVVILPPSKLKPGDKINSS